MASMARLQDMDEDEFLQLISNLEVLLSEYTSIIPDKEQNEKELENAKKLMEAVMNEYYDENHTDKSDFQFSS